MGDMDDKMRCLQERAELLEVVVKKLQEERQQDRAQIAELTLQVEQLGGSALPAKS